MVFSRTVQYVRLIIGIHWKSCINGACICKVGQHLHLIARLQSHCDVDLIIPVPYPSFGPKRSFARFAGS